MNMLLVKPLLLMAVTHFYRITPLIHNEITPVGMFLVIYSQDYESTRKSYGAC